MHSRTPLYIEVISGFTLVFHLMIEFHCNHLYISKAKSLVSEDVSNTLKTHVFGAPPVAHKIPSVSMVKRDQSLFVHQYGFKSTFAHVILCLPSIAQDDHQLYGHMKLLSWNHSVSLLESSSSHPLFVLSP